MQCPNCGKDNLPGTQFCESCGQSLLSANQAFIQPIPPQKNNAGKYILGVVIGLLLSLFAVGTITLVHNSLAQRPVETKTKLKTEVYDGSQTDENEAESTNDEAESEADEDAPVPVVANGQTTNWVSDDGPVLRINGTTTVTIAGGSKMPPVGTYDIKGIKNNGEEFYIAKGPASMGEIKIVGNVLTLNNQGQITTYHYYPDLESDTNSDDSTYEDDDNIYDAD